LVKNLNNQNFSRDPANVFGKNTAKDVGMLRDTARYYVTEKDSSKVTVVTKRRRGRVTKRKGKRSQMSASQVTKTSGDFANVGDLKGKVCHFVLWKLNRAKKAQRRAQKLASMAENK
jgi:hypothetical protein